MAGKYKLRNGTLSTADVTVKHLVVKNENKSGRLTNTPYLKLYPVAASGNPVYIYVGTAGRVCASSTAPVGTTGVFANTGSPLGTSA